MSPSGRWTSSVTTDVCTTGTARRPQERRSPMTGPIESRRRPRRRCAARTSVVVMACLSLGVPVTAAASDVDDTRREDVSTSQLTSKWRIFAGGNFTDFNTTAGWSAQGLAGAVILVEDTLGRYRRGQRDPFPGSKPRCSSADRDGRRSGPRCRHSRRRGRFHRRICGRSGHSWT